MATKILSILFLLVVAASTISGLDTEITSNVETRPTRALKGGRKGSSFYDDDGPYYKGKGKGKGIFSKGYYIYLNVVNLAFMQPFSEFFVMVHDGTIEPLFTLGTPASGSLQVLAEDASAAALVADYEGTKGVLSAEVFSAGAPFLVGQKVVIPVWVNKLYPFVTIAAKLMNTNDGFVSINGMNLGSSLDSITPGGALAVTGGSGGVSGIFDYSVTGVGYDAGTAGNNIDDLLRTRKLQEGEGEIRTRKMQERKVQVLFEPEGYVHVSRGVHGIGDLEPSIYDWRNPVLLVKIE